MSRPLIHTPEGVRDIYGTEYRTKLTVEDRLHHVLSSFGYQDIQTPTFEFFDVFGSSIGTTPSRELYKFFDKEGNTLVLRPDFTPSMARCAAKYFMGEKLPIRFSYQGNTFTNTSNLRGRLKEVTQIGAELVQEPSVQADGEMIAMLVEALRAAGLEDFQVSVGHVEYFKGLCSLAGLDEETELELRELISGKNFFGAQELLENSQVRRDYAQVLLKVYDLSGPVSVLEQAAGLVDNERSLQAVERLQELYQVLCQYGVEKYVSFDLGLLSKYNYYTGIVFKAYTYGVGDAVAKGGRYDRLLGHFGKDAAAVGFVVVADDLLEALSRQNRLPDGKPQGVLIVYEKNHFADALKLAREQRAAGVPAELMPAETEAADAGTKAEPQAKAATGTEANQAPAALQPYLEAAAEHQQKQLLYLDAQGGMQRIDVSQETAGR
ncbi:MAG TPA: ATP phosphoribosyltransferase regulatory subunit [Candidatus Eisenbergiella merdavium]|uniref:ATP phosphoribosyltransferase regulatory subunit n=1 Tax=Candidatus Eisenbergiella merdavium TaxID=2838551 RepID=A0A9D2SPG2_9FIRM|nr:ATP phosphoribosyltransferase regulatory subunit [Candidatus Eisenbergiella merdavium]